MSGPMTRDQWPADVREFRDELAAFNLAVGEWLGLDPSQVFRFDLTEGKPPKFRDVGTPDPGTYTRVTWESTEKQTPRAGHVTHGGRSDEDLGVVFTAELVLDWDDDQARLEVTGPKPQLFSDEEQSALRQRFGV